MLAWNVWLMAHVKGSPRVIGPEGSYRSDLPSQAKQAGFVRKPFGCFCSTKLLLHCCILSIKPVGTCRATRGEAQGSANSKPEKSDYSHSVLTSGKDDQSHWSLCDREDSKWVPYTKGTNVSNNTLEKKTLLKSVTQKWSRQSKTFSHKRLD